VNDSRVAEQEVRVCDQRGSGVTAAAGDDGRNDLRGEPTGDLVEDRDGELIDRLKALVEVTLGQAGLVADVADARRRDAARAEQFEPRVEELLATDSEPLVGADTAVRPGARGGGAEGRVNRWDPDIIFIFDTSSYQT
jgi:hypothetical protein